MAGQRPEAAELSLEEAIEILERLAGAGPAAAPADQAPAPALPPRSAAQAAWSESIFRDLIETLPDAVVVIDAGGAIVFVNAQAERLFGYARGELLGEVIEVLVPERVR